MKPDVLVIYPTLAPQLAVLDATYTLHRYDLADAVGREAMLDGPGQRCQAIVTNGHAALPREMIARLPALKVVACSSAGYETIDVEALSERGVTLTNTSDALSDDVADLAMLLLMASRRNLVAAHAYVTSGDWGRKGMYPLQSSLKGKRLGVVGMGKIGQAIAPRAQAMGLDVAYFSRSERKGLGLSFQPDLLALAHWADALIVIVAGGAGTRNLISDAVLAGAWAAGNVGKCQPRNRRRRSCTDRGAARWRAGGGGAGCLLERA